VLATAGGIEARTLIAHASLTLSAKAANPPPPLAGTQARIYVKGAKLVMQWNDGVKTLYTTVQLDDPGPYPSTPKVTTDTSAP